MPELLLRNRPLESVFELMGSDENSLTFALGWCMREAPALLSAIAAMIEAETPDDKTTTVLLQEFGGRHGFTDIEVRDPGRLAWVFEAKVGFDPPGEAQLRKYAERLLSRDDRLAEPLLIVVARSDRRNLVLRRVTPDEIDGVRVAVLSWGAVLACCDQAYPSLGNGGKAAIRQLTVFIRKVLDMRDQESNAVYVVSVSGKLYEPAGTTFDAIVAEHRRYFHPVGAGWPKTPPNYIAFRWGGRLQSIHHVESHKVVESMEGEFPDATAETIDKHFLYTLGPPIRPAHVVQTGNIYPSGRVWAALDLLLTCGTISEARDATAARHARQA